MKKFLFGLLTLAIGAGMVFASYQPAYADGTVTWGGNGSENLPCPNGAHWVLAPAFNINSATLYVNGASYAMHQSGQGSWAADSSGAIDSNVQAYATYTGAGDERNHLQLSHCLEGESTKTPYPSPTSENTPTFTATAVNTPTNTPTFTSTPENTPTNTPTLPATTPAQTNTPYPSPTEQNTPTFTATPGDTPEVTPENTPTQPPQNTPANTPTYTLTPGVTETITPTLPGKGPAIYCQAASYVVLSNDAIRVMGLANKKIANKPVTVRDSNHNIIAKTTTDSNGYFQVDVSPIPSGTIKVSVLGDASHLCELTLGAPTAAPKAPKTGFMEAQSASLPVAYPYKDLFVPGLGVAVFGFLVMVLSMRRKRELTD